jgi:hypothetical protein
MSTSRAQPSTTALLPPARGDDAWLMINDSSRAMRLVLLRRALLAIAVLVTAAAAAVFVFAAYLFTEGYSGGGSAQSVAPLAFPLAFLVLAVVGAPVALICAASWIGYLAAASRSRSLP